MRVTLLAAGFAVVAVACSSSTGGGTTAPQQACLDLADAVAKAAVRCNLGDYQSNYNAFIQAAANGNCANITSVRDMTSLRGTCIPSFGTISCAALQAAMLDPSCSQQLIRQ